MDINPLEFLKYLWIAYEVIFHFINRKREKTLVAMLTEHDQRLNKLENELRLKP